MARSLRPDVKPSITAWDLTAGSGPTLDERYRIKIETQYGTWEGTFTPQSVPKPSYALAYHYAGVWWYGVINIGTAVEAYREVIAMFLTWHPMTPDAVEIPACPEEGLPAGRREEFNSVEELVGHVLRCHHWPPPEYVLKICACLLSANR